MDTKKLKLRTTYPAGFRTKAKALGHGVATVSIEFSNGDRMEEQGTVDHHRAEFLKWAMTMAFCEELQELPDLNTLIKELIS